MDWKAFNRTRPLTQNLDDWLAGSAVNCRNCKRHCTCGLTAPDYDKDYIAETCIAETRIAETRIAELTETSPCDEYSGVQSELESSGVLFV